MKEQQQLLNSLEEFQIANQEVENFCYAGKNISANHTVSNEATKPH